MKLSTLILLLILSTSCLAAKPHLNWGIHGDTLDFGRKVAGAEYEREVRLTNSSAELRQIDEWQSACPCVAIRALPKYVEPGASSSIIIALKSEPIERGYYGTSVFILSDDPIRPIARLPVKVIWTDPQGSVQPPAGEGFTEAPPLSQEAVAPTVPRSSSQITYEQQVEIERERQSRLLASDPRIDSLVGTLPESLRAAFHNIMSLMAAKSFNTSSLPVLPNTTPKPAASTSDTLFDWRDGELSARAFDSISAVLSGQEWVPPDVEESEWQQQLRNPLKIEYYHSYTCRICREATGVIENITLQYGGRVIVRHFSTDTDSGLARMIKLRSERKIKPDPFVLIVGQYHFLNPASLDSLQQYIDSALVQDRIDENLASDPISIIRSTMRSFSFWTMIMAGLLDGINPCAFATLIFFLSMIAYVGGSRKELLIVGIPFTLTVFVTYLLLGVGAFGILTQLTAYRWIAQLIYIATAIIVFVLTLLTFKDLWEFMNGAPPSSAILQLPDSFKRRIHAVMRENLKPGRLVLGSIVIGFLVTIFESVCTGQVYLPTIVMMLNDPELKGQAWLNLFLYNLMFVAPLLIIFLLAYQGVTSKTIGEWSKRNYGWIKFSLFILFATLLTVMVWELMK